MADRNSLSENHTPRVSDEREQRGLRSGSFHASMLVFGVAAALAFLPLWAPLLLASWVAMVARPLHARLAKSVGGRSRAAGVVTVLLVLVALAPLVTIGLSLFGAAVDLAHQLRQTGGARDALGTLLKTTPSLSTGVDPKQAMDFAERHGGGALNAATLIFGAATSAAIGTFVFIYGFYTCLVHGRRAYEWLLEHSPLERSQTARYAAAYTETGRGLLLGVGVTALLQGAIATIGYLIIGVPQGLVLGLVTVLAALIPSIGTGLVWVPVAAGMFIAGRTTEAVAVIAVGVVMSVADNFVRPILSRHGHLDLPTFVLFCAMLGGIGIFGAWGLLAGPLFARMAVEALRLGREQRELGEPVQLFESSALPSPRQVVLATPGE